MSPEKRIQNEIDKLLVEIRAELEPLYEPDFKVADFETMAPPKGIAAEVAAEAGLRALKETATAQFGPALGETFDTLARQMVEAHKAAVLATTDSSK